MRIRLAEVEAKFRAAAEVATRGDEGDPLGQFMAWAADPANELEPDAEAFLDSLLLALAEGMWDTVRLDPTHPMHKSLRRHLAALRGEHSTAAAQLAGLESAPAPADMGKGKEQVTDFVVDVVQLVRDVCFDESQLPNRSWIQVEDTAMILGCGDELIAGLALYRHNYMSQAGTHARTVLETVELLELFELRPELREVWRSKEPGAVPGKGLRPWEVRKETGKQGRNVFYDLLCDLSSHPRNLWARSRVGLSAGADGLGDLQATVSSAGTADAFPRVAVSAGLVFVATLVALRLTLTSLSEAALSANVERAQSLSAKAADALEECLDRAAEKSVPGLSEIVSELRSALADTEVAGGDASEVG